MTVIPADSPQGNTRNPYIKNYSFRFDFGGRWGQCDVLMTAVSGHLTDAKFGPEYNKWDHPPPVALFSAPIRVQVDDVWILCGKQLGKLLTKFI